MRRGVRWRYANDAETAAFRHRPTKDKGVFDPRSDVNRGLATTFGVGEVKGYDGLVELPEGLRIKVLTDAEMDKHRGVLWVYIVVEASVSYGDRVESLKPGTPIAILPEDLDT